MAGIYIHIPFCKQACNYCDFHFSVSLAKKNEFIKALIKEIKLRKNYLSENSVYETIYFGGGTPSILSAVDVQLIMKNIYEHFVITQNAEISFEMNPDDSSSEYLQALKQIGINRLSIGTQSFDESHLQLMNRVHNREEAKNCIELAHKNGFDNISVDLIYGIPAPNHDILKNDLEILLSQNISHISAYALTIEEKTAFGRLNKRGKFKNPENEFVAEQYEIVNDTLTKNGFEQYEISNYCKNNHYSKHNSAYWKMIPYIGLGPSAHSFSGKNRAYNPANNSLYIEKYSQDELFVVDENLDKIDLANDYLLTSLRTKWGCSMSYINTLVENYENNFRQKISKLEEQSLIFEKNHFIFLTDKGKLIADTVLETLFIPIEWKKLK